MMTELLTFIAIFGGWIALQKWILPALGVPTCMSGACRTPAAEQFDRHRTENRHRPDPDET
jgi:hypothetical protein